MNPVRVSVVIPAYNEEKLLARCLESLQNQTVKPYEIIVVDNNSVDSTAAIARSHDVIVIQEANQGMIWARNAGFNYATGDILARLDADCIAPENWISKITGYYQNRPLEASSGLTGNGYYATNSRLVGQVLGFGMSTAFHTGNRLMLRSVTLYGSCMAFPRAWWDEIKDEACTDSDAYHEDIDLSMHLFKKNHKVVKLAGFYTYIDTRTLHEPLSKTWWRWRTWPQSIYRHRREQGLHE